MTRLTYAVRDEEGIIAAFYTEKGATLFARNAPADRQYIIHKLAISKESELSYLLQDAISMLRWDKPMTAVSWSNWIEHACTTLDEVKNETLRMAHDSGA